MYLRRQCLHIFSEAKDCCSHCTPSNKTTTNWGKPYSAGGMQQPKKKKHFSLPPLTMKFNRWNTFWVVQPYSGTRSSIRINWICKSQFHEQLKERIWSSPTGSKIQAEENMKPHEFPRPSQTSTQTQTPTYDLKP